MSMSLRTTVPKHLAPQKGPPARHQNTGTAQPTSATSPPPGPCPWPSGPLDPNPHCQAKIGRGFYDTSLLCGNIYEKMVRMIQMTEMPILTDVEMGFSRCGPPPGVVSGMLAELRCHFGVRDLIGSWGALLFLGRKQA